MTDDRSEDLSYENEGGMRSTVTITLKEYDALREKQKYTLKTFTFTAVADNG